MTPLTCRQADDHLELFALGECDEPLRSAVESHVASCQNCSRALDQARQFLGLMDLEHQKEQRLERLFARLEREARPRPPKRRVLHFPRRAAALAALVLVAVGLAWMAPGGELNTIEEPQSPAKAERVMLDASPPRATVWDSPRHPGRRIPAGPIRLDQGRLWICREGPRENSPGLSVITPFGDIRIHEGCAFVSVTSEATAMTVFSGEVELKTPQGTINGSRGDLLLASKDVPPSRIFKNH